MLAAAGRALAEAVPPAVAAWVPRAVAGALDAWAAAGWPGSPSPGRPPPGFDRSAVLAQAEAAGRSAAAAVAVGLGRLAGEDVDAQRTTPLSEVRTAVGPATAVLRSVGVPPVERDRFQAGRFPDDDYGLVPASLAALDPGLAEVQLAWAAAKVLAHRARHG